MCVILVRGESEREREDSKDRRFSLVSAWCGAGRVIRSNASIHCIFQAKCSWEIGKERSSVNGRIVRRQPHPKTYSFSHRLTINVLNLLVPNAPDPTIQTHTATRREHRPVPPRSLSCRTIVTFGVINDEMREPTSYFSLPIIKYYIWHRRKLM